MATSSSGRSSQPRTGFIFYPGARVAAEAYAPLVRAIAEAGYLVVITPDALRPGRARTGRRRRASSTPIPRSSTGSSAAIRLEVPWPPSTPPRTRTRVDGLALWAAYPADGTDLSGADLVVSLHLREQRRTGHAGRDRGFGSPTAGRHDVRRDRTAATTPSSAGTASRAATVRRPSRPPISRTRWWPRRSRSWRRCRRPVAPRVVRSASTPRAAGSRCP